MTPWDPLGPGLRFQTALAVGLLVALVGTLVVMPRAIRKLRGAGILGQDRHKPDHVRIPEMGGLGLFVAFNIGTFSVLTLASIPDGEVSLILASLITAAGACMAGVLDDLIDLRQRFKAIIPLGFAVPLALFVRDTAIDLPLYGTADFGIMYGLLLVPLGVACASNGFNMLEGFNGLGAGLGIIMASTLSAIVIMEGNYFGLTLLFPLLGALGGFLWFNFYPARVFPGDSMTLLVGAVLASAAIIGKVEFWGLLLFVPHVVEFFLKARAGFNAQSFATGLRGRKLVYRGPIRSLTHVLMRGSGLSELQLVARLWLLHAVYATLVVAGYMAWRTSAPA